MKQITRDISSLKEQDLINIILYGIYKLTGDPEYSTLSELIYTLDKENLLRLCSTYGGCTIKIPTVNELKTLVEGLMVYQEVNVEKRSFGQACNKLNIQPTDRKNIFNIYSVLSEIIGDYHE